MELQFQKEVISYLDRVVWESQTQEQTQELRLSEAMADIGMILSAWGQVILRSKQWRNDCVCVTGGISVWVIYLPEGESKPQSVDCWIPFQMKWNLPRLDQEGTMSLDCNLQYLDARLISARKMMIRAGIGATLEALVESEAETYTPIELSEDVQLLKTTFPLNLTCEAGEKAFSLEEELNIPATLPAPEKILYYNVNPKVTETQIDENKLIIRGNAPLHMGYLDSEGTLNACTLDMMFSQLISLKQNRTNMAKATVTMAVSNLEVDIFDGCLDVRCGLVGQYAVDDQVELDVVKDAYSTTRPLKITTQTINIPTQLERKHIQEPVSVHLEAAADVVLDSWFLTEQPLSYREEDHLRLEVIGQCGVLYRDEDGKIANTTARWELQTQMPGIQDCKVVVTGLSGGAEKCTVSPNGVQMQTEPLITICTLVKESISMISGLELGEQTEGEKEKPALILRRAENDDLWNLAKESGSTVDMIRKANQLEESPQPGQWLLIPLC